MVLNRRSNFVYGLSSPFAKSKSGVYVLNNLKKISYLSFCAILFFTGLASTAAAQDRPRVIKTVSSRPINLPPVATSTVNKTTTLSSSTPVNSSASRPVLTNEIVVNRPEEPKQLVKKTGSSSPLNSLATLAASKMVYAPSVSGGIMHGIQERLGIPYRYGSSGPNRYDCSGFVWAVFKDAGIDFERTSARNLWNASVPVTGDERFKFGTLVFMNGLGHMGIVADENGFYHASSSKGITYSTFKGYWEKRITGFRRLPAMATAPVPVAQENEPVPVK